MPDVGKTPMMEVDGIYAKLECTNPLGSIKDRIAKYILEESEKKGILKPGMKIVEASSGNTGIALSYFAKQMGYDIFVVMPENMSEERKSILRELGAKLILCSEGNFAEAAEIRDAMAEKHNYFNPDQFSNPLNTECHYNTTAQEIIEQIKPHSEKVDAFVAGVGTGGTLIGGGKALRDAFGNTKIIAVEPLESAVMSGGDPGIHGIQGIGDGFIPDIATNGNGELHEMIDEVVAISTQEAKDTARYLYSGMGLCVGVSSGANFLASKRIKDRFKTIVTIFPDGYKKYVSQGITGCDPEKCMRVCNCPMRKECNKGCPKP
jgi:cysteine synthase A